MCVYRYACIYIYMPWDVYQLNLAPASEAHAWDFLRFSWGKLTSVSLEGAPSVRPAGSHKRSSFAV